MEYVANGVGGCGFARPDPGALLSNGLQLGDALIAATALEHGLVLLSGNKKHFAKLPSLALQVFKP